MCLQLFHSWTNTHWAQISATTVDFFLLFLFFTSLHSSSNPNVRHTSSRITRTFIAVIDLRRSQSPLCHGWSGLVVLWHIIFRHLLIRLSHLKRPAGRGDVINQRYVTSCSQQPSQSNIKHRNTVSDIEITHFTCAFHHKSTCWGWWQHQLVRLS